jgi:hypothetical protein
VPDTKISLQSRGKQAITQSAFNTNGQPPAEKTKMEVVKTETKVENAILTFKQRIQKVKELNRHGTSKPGFARWQNNSLE